MAKRKLGMEHAPLARGVVDVLLQEKNPVHQQVAIELVTFWFASRMGSVAQARTVIDGIHKHVGQMLEQWEEQLR